MRFLLHGLGLGLGLSLAACAPAYSHTASTTFASTYSCPLDRETVVPTAPPAEIAADPARTSVWHAHHHAFTVTGCGHTQQLDCYVSGGDAINPWVECNPAWLATWGM
ncbi:MAG: hypothetical protein ABI467_24835 [Kofleriaceae bacterium]